MTSSATAQAVSTTSTIIEIDPCSNDNPEWDSATQPCPNSITDYIFEGAVTTRPPVTTTTTTVEEEIFSTSSTDRDYPTSYSCETNTPSDTQTTPSTDNQQENNDREAIYLKFNYEIYTILNQTQQDINRILGEFESNLGYGVANSLGLTDCQDASSDNSNNERVGGSNFLFRRSLRKRELEETKDDEGSSGGLFAEVSTEPVDIIDTTVSECTSKSTLETPNQCTPIHGFMTAYLTNEETQRLRQLHRELNELTTPEQYLHNTIQSYMKNNATHYVTNNLLSVSYIGPNNNNGEIQQIDPEVSTRPIDASNINNKENYAGSKYIGISVATIFIVALLMGLIYHREKKRKEKEQRKSRENNDDVEMENGDGDLEAIVADDGDEHDDDDALLPPMDSMAATDGDSSVEDETPAKSLSKDSMMLPHESSLLPPLDLHESPSDDDMLYGKDDQSAESQPIDRVFSDAESQPMIVSEDHPERDDDSNVSPPRLVEEDSISRDSNSSNEVDTNWGGYVDNTLDTMESTNVDVNISPSEVTERTSNAAPFYR